MTYVLWSLYTFIRIRMSLKNNLYFNAFSHTVDKINAGKNQRSRKMFANV